MYSEGVVTIALAIANWLRPDDCPDSDDYALAEVIAAELFKGVTVLFDESVRDLNSDTLRSYEISQVVGEIEAYEKVRKMFKVGHDH
jgi:hypothetical protein